MNRHQSNSLARFVNCLALPSQPSRVAATNSNPRFEFRLVGSTDDQPDRRDIEAVARLSHNNTRIRRSNPDLTFEKRCDLYANWFMGNPRVFALLERFPADKSGTSIIANTAILPLTNPILKSLQDGKRKVISLEPREICKGTRFGSLLLDTWVIDSRHQEMLPILGIRRTGHRGYGNLLLLRHIAEFWTPDRFVRNRKGLMVYAEPDSASMRAALPNWGFDHVGWTAINEPIYRFAYPHEGTASPSPLLQKVIEGVGNSGQLW